MERNGKPRMRWLSGIALLVLLAACAPVQEAPQGITGVWKGTATSTPTGQEISKSFWLEQGSGTNTVSVMNDPGGTGTFNSGTNALHLVFAAPGSSMVLDGTKSGNQITGTYTVTQNSTQIDSGTFRMDFQMHPADLDTGNSQNAYVSAWGGFTYLDFSTPYLWVNATDNYDATVSWDGSNFVMAPGPGASLFPGTGSANQEDFWVRANVGGPLDASVGIFPSVVIQNPGQLIFVKTRENRFAMVWVEWLVPGNSVNLRSIYGYGGYAFNGTPPNNQTYVQRRKTGAAGPVTYRFFMELRVPDTGVPVDPTRIDTTSFRVASSNFAGMQIPVKPASEQAYDATYFSAGTINRQVAMAGDLNVTGLSSGYYGLTARDILGYTYVGLAYYDNTLDLARLPSSPAAMETSPDNTVLGVRNPGLTTTTYPCTDNVGVRFTVFINTNPDNKFVYGDSISLQPGDTGGAKYTFTVPPAAVDFLRTKGALQWQALVRYYKNGYEVFRHYSDPQPISF